MVIDTHIFLWYCLGDPRLRKELADKLQRNPTGTIVPSICFWEAMMLHQGGRIDMGSDPVKTIQVLLDKSGFITHDLTREIAVLSRTLTFFHNDPADRFIAATAYALGQELATDDINMRKLSWLRFA